jgi:hypothetical protein
LFKPAQCAFIVQKVALLNLRIHHEKHFQLQIE